MHEPETLDASIQWEATMDVALARARADQKPILIHFFKPD